MGRVWKAFENSQLIPAARRVDWYARGVPGATAREINKDTGRPSFDRRVDVSGGWY
jgi:hypothetical protein